MRHHSVAFARAPTMTDDGDDMLPQLCGDSSSDDEKPKRGGSDSDEPSSSLSLTRPAGKQRRLRTILPLLIPLLATRWVPRRLRSGPLGLPGHRLRD